MKRVLTAALAFLCLAAFGGEQDNRRLSFYAPPTIPHDLVEGTACLDCHETNDAGAPMIPHQKFANCRQCHVAQNEVTPFRKSVFQPVAGPKKLPRAYPGAPPVIPHRVFMRETCLACHAQGARANVVATPHPERPNCRQCHVPQDRDVALFRRNLNLADPLE